MRMRIESRLWVRRTIIVLTAVLLCMTAVPLTARSPGIAQPAQPSTFFETCRDNFDHIRYDPRDPQTKHKLRLLISELQRYSDQHPQNPKNMALLGILFAYQAKVTGGLGALSSAKQARALLEAAITLEENVLNGYALVCTGTLYALTPIWPIGFRNVERARLLIERAYTLNPHNIDVLFYYAYYQYHTLHQTKKALNTLKAALALPLPARRSFAFLGRRGEVEALLQKAQRTNQW